MTGQPLGKLTVMLEHLVTRLSSATTPDIPRSWAPEGGSILANVVPPDVLEGARAKAMHTFSLVRANDGILQCSAGLEDEDGSFPIKLCLTATVTVSALPVEERHTAVKDLAGGDDRGSGESGAAGGRGPSRVDGGVGAVHAAGDLP